MAPAGAPREAMRPAPPCRLVDQEDRSHGADRDDSSEARLRSPAREDGEDADATRYCQERRGDDSESSARPPQQRPHVRLLSQACLDFCHERLGIQPH